MNSRRQNRRGRCGGVSTRHRLLTLKNQSLGVNPYSSSALMSTTRFCSGSSVGMGIATFAMPLPWPLQIAPGYAPQLTHAPSAALLPHSVSFLYPYLLPFLTYSLLSHLLFTHFLLTPRPPPYILPQEKKKDFERKSRLHKNTHTRARNYFRDAVHASQKHPDQVECYNADAPTNSRFELPRLNTDPPKCLEGIKKWKQKVMGVWCYGYGMKFYVTAGAPPSPSFPLTTLSNTHITLVATHPPTHHLSTHLPLTIPCTK